MDELEKFLEKLKDSVLAGYAYHQTWFALMGDGKAWSHYLHVMNKGTRSDFFQVIKSGLYKLMFVEAGCIFDTDGRTASIRNLKLHLSDINRSDLVSEIDRVLAPHCEVAKKMVAIRTRLIAHKDTKAESISLHEKYGLTPNEIKHVYSDLGVLMNTLHSNLFGKTSFVFCPTGTERFENSLLEILDSLSKNKP